MKGQLDQTKVLLRHLPPTISQSMLMEQIDSSFSGRYNWVSFRPGKNSQKRTFYSRAYIDFKSPDNVLEFAEFFHGHVFVSEKGTQFRTVVEFSPSQRVPKACKKDGREGTILKDPEYMEFLDFISKPIENLPSAEIQLERKDAERAGAVAENIVTPLMDFVRKKRAAKSLSRKSLSSGKLNRKLVEQGGTASSSSSKRGPEKKKILSKMYVLRDPGKASSGKDKKTYILAPKRDKQQLSSDAAAAASDAHEEKAVCWPSGGGNKKVLRLKGGDREISMETDTPSVGRNTHEYSKQNQRREGGGKIIRSILMKDAHRKAEMQSELPRRAPRSSSNLNVAIRDVNGVSEDKCVGNDSHVAGSEKQERRSRTKDKNDNGVWTPLHRMDARDKSFTSLSLNYSDGIVSPSHSIIGIAGGTLESRSHGAGRPVYPSAENGSYKHSKSGSHHGTKDDSSSIETRSSRRGPPSYGSQEKQVWVQKSSAGC